MFESPGEPGTHPQSLLQLLKSTEVKPSLREKFMLAHGLARSIAQLQMVQWVHESFRSENILLFLPQSTQDAHEIIRRSLLVPFDQP